MIVRKWLTLLIGVVSLTLGLAAPVSAEGRDVQHTVNITVREELGCGVGWGTSTFSEVSWADPANPDTTWFAHGHSRFVSDSGYEWVGAYSITLKDWVVDVPQQGTISMTVNVQSRLVPVGRDAATRPTLFLSQAMHLTFVDGELKADPVRFVSDNCTPV